MSETTIQITLSSANMGDVDEVDFDCWAGFVNEKIDDVAGETVTVDQFRFGASGEDRIEGATEEQAATIRAWISVTGWEAFCGEEWNRRRAEREAA